jgi:hypothetical protein
MQVVTTTRAFLSNSPEVASSLSSPVQLSRPTACLACGLRPTASMKGGVLVAFTVLLTRDGGHSPWNRRWTQTMKQTVDAAHETDGGHSPWNRRWTQPMRQTVDTTHETEDTCHERDGGHSPWDRWWTQFMKQTVDTAHETDGGHSPWKKRWTWPMKQTTPYVKYQT